MCNYWNIHNITYDENSVKEMVNNLPSNVFYQFDQNKNIFTFLEYIIYNISIFHSNRLQINNKCIEFGFIEKNINFCKLDQSFSLLSIAVFLNNDDSPLLISNLTDDTYKYKYFNDISISCSFPKKLNHIIFQPSKYYYSLHNEKTLIINIMNEFGSQSIPFPDKLFSCNYILNTNIQCNTHTIYTSNDKDNKYEIVIKEDKCKTIFFHESKNDFNYDYFNELIYIDSTNYKTLAQLIKHKDRRLFDNFEFKLDKNKNNTINDINNSERIDITMPKFIQRFIKRKVYNHDICNWIIRESEKYANENGGWSTTRHKTYPTTDLPVNKIANIYSFVFESFRHIIQDIKTLYCLYDKHFYKVNDLFIVKYDANRQSNLELHTDNSDISVNILLSSPSDFEGGGTYFDDGIITHIRKGDALIHCGQTKHSGIDITKGTRYILVSFINIYKEL